MKTKAAVLVKQHNPLEIMDLEIPGLKKGQVLIEILATTICGSQIGEIDGVKGEDKWLPHCLGHEAGAVVRDTGDGVQTVKPGDHVIVHWRPGSGIDAEPAAYKSGNLKVNAGKVTTFQQFSVVSENRLTKAPENLDPKIASLFGCCVTTGFGAVERDAGMKEGQSILVYGAGGVGLMSILSAKLLGASKIVAVDVVDERLQMAKEFGATHSISGKEDSLEGKILNLFEGKGPDVVIENTGIKEVIEISYRICHPRGITVLVGVPKCGEKAEIDTLPLHFGKKITGSCGGSSDPDIDINTILSRLNSSKFNIGNIMSKAYRVTDINQAIHEMRNQQVLKPVILMS